MSVPAVLKFAACALLMACSREPGAGGDGDFAVLAQGAQGYRQAVEGHPLEFPRDHGSHPGFRIEWWYLTANLQDPDGRDYGAQWTLFRTAVQAPGQAAAPANPWQDAQVFMAHLAISTPGEHFSFQRYARGGEHGGVAQAGVESRPFRAWLDDWALYSTAVAWLPLRLEARQGDYGLRLQMDTDRPLVLQGDAGFSRKRAAGGGSHYYSQPFLSATGELTVRGQRLPVSGEAWLDREWSSQFLQAGESGWDWFALHLDSGEKLMLFRIRAAPSPGGAGDFLHAVLIAADGGKTVLDQRRVGLRALGATRVAGRDLPLHWRVELPEIGRSLEVRALHPDQWMAVDFAYWEGVVLVNGDGPGNSGRGYLELTGYPRQ